MECARYDLAGVLQAQRSILLLGILLCSRKGPVVPQMPHRHCCDRSTVARRLQIPQEFNAALTPLHSGTVSTKDTAPCVFHIFTVCILQFPPQHLYLVASIAPCPATQRDIVEKARCSWCLLPHLHLRLCIWRTHFIQSERGGLSYFIHYDEEHRHRISLFQHHHRTSF